MDYNIEETLYTGVFRMPQGIFGLRVCNTPYYNIISNLTEQADGNVFFNFMGENDFSLSNASFSSETGAVLWLNIFPINDSVSLDEDEYLGTHFRYVLIPANIQLSGLDGAAVSRSTSNIDWTKLSYEEVVELLQLDN